jgi:predicted metal-dependent hydrolase
MLIFNRRLSALVERFDLPMAANLKIRKMKAKWGSCSQSGVITLNLWLITQDIKAIDYVILHELCHLKHFDHTPAFYGYLAGFMPDWRAHKALLV